MGRINIDITADDQSDGELVSRLIATTLTGNDFIDVTNTGSLHHTDTDVDVLESMRNLSPSIFASEVTIDVDTFDTPGDEVPGIGEFPTGDEDDEVDALPDER